MSTTKLTEKENLTMYACRWAPGGPIDKENQVKIYNKFLFNKRGYSLFNKTCRGDNID